MKKIKEYSGEIIVYVSIILVVVCCSLTVNNTNDDVTLRKTEITERYVLS